MKRERKMLQAILILAVFLAGCDQVLVEIKPTVRTFPTLTPERLPTSSPTPEPTPTITPIIPARQETAVPMPGELIQPENVERLVEYGERGNGLATQAHWSPAGNQFAISTTQGIYLFNRDLSLASAYKTGTAVQALAFSPDGNLLAGGQADGRILVWELIRNEMIRELSTEGAVWLSMAFSPEGDSLAAAGWQTPVTVWTMDGGNVFSRISVHESAVKSLAFTADGGQLLSWARTEPVWITSLEGQAAARNIAMRKDNLGFRPRKIKFSQSGATLLAIHERQLSLMTTDRGFTLITIYDFKDSLLDAALSPDESVIATAERIGIRLWNSQNGLLLEELSLPPPGSIRTMLEFSPDGKYLLAVGNSIQLWPLEGMDEAAVNEAVQFTTDYHLASMPLDDGTGILSLLLDGSVMETDLASGVQHLYPNSNADIASISKPFSSGRLAYTTSEGNAAVWDYRKGEVILEIGMPKKDSAAAVLSGDGKRLAVMTKNETIEIYDVDQGEQLSSFTIDGKPLDAIFSPEGSLLMIHTTDGLQLWQTDPPLLSGNYAGYRGEFSSDGRRLALARKDLGQQVIEVWNVQSQEMISNFRAEGASLAFSADGSILAMAGRNIVLWSVSGGERLAEMSLQDVSLNGDILFTPGGETLVYAAMDGSLRFWGIQ